MQQTWEVDRWIPICEVADKHLLAVIEGHAHWYFAWMGDPNFVVRLEFVKFEASYVTRMVDSAEEGKWILYVYAVPLEDWLTMDARCQKHYAAECTFAWCHETLHGGVVGAQV